MKGSYGWEVRHNEASGPRGIISEPFRSSSGNLVLRVGRQNAPHDTWTQTEHVVLTPEEARDYFGRVAALLDPLVAVERSQVARAAIEAFIERLGPVGELSDPDIARAMTDSIVRLVTVGR